MRHAVPNAVHPLVMYQGVVLPYMLSGEIETAIIFALPTVGPPSSAPWRWVTSMSPRPS